MTTHHRAARARRLVFIEEAECTYAPGPLHCIVGTAGPDDQLGAAQSESTGDTLPPGSAAAVGGSVWREGSLSYDGLDAESTVASGASGECASDGAECAASSDDGVE